MSKLTEAKPLTVESRTGRVVLASVTKYSNGALWPVTYSNRTQAQKKADSLGVGWEVFQPGLSVVFYVAKKA